MPAPSPSLGYPAPWGVAEILWFGQNDGVWKSESKSELILGIETSCDETAAAVVEGGGSATLTAGSRVLSNVVARQAEFHRKWGGVVPEIASRKHLETINYVIEEALEGAGVVLEAMEAIAVTVGPGLEGSLLVGVSTAKGICVALGKPLIAVNHLEGHVCANFLVEAPPPLPFVCLVASGGHSDIVAVRPGSPRTVPEEGTSVLVGGGLRCGGEALPRPERITDSPLQYEPLGSTRDDAAGEAFDKVGRVLGFDYPAGAEVDETAKKGNRRAIDFPRTHFRGSFDFSFSGVKTAAARYVAKLSQEELRRQRADICASFQEAVVGVLVEHTLAAAEGQGIGTICVGGGVAANSRLRALLGGRCEERGLRVFFPPAELCLDNAAMIAAAAHWKLGRGEVAGLGVDVFPGLGWSFEGTAARIE